MYETMSYSEIGKDLKRRLKDFVDTIESITPQELKLPPAFTLAYKKIKSVQDLTDALIIQKTLTDNLKKIQGIEAGNDAVLTTHLKTVTEELQDILNDIPEDSMLTAKKQTENQPSTSSPDIAGMLADMKLQQQLQHAEAQRANRETQEKMDSMGKTIVTMGETIEELNKNSQVLGDFARIIRYGFGDVYAKATLQLDDTKQRHLLTLTAEENDLEPAPYTPQLFGEASSSTSKKIDAGSRSKKTEKTGANFFQDALDILKRYLKPYLKGMRYDSEKKNFVTSVEGNEKETYAKRATLIENLLKKVTATNKAYSMIAQLYVSFFLTYKYSDSMQDIIPVIGKFLKDKGIELPAEIIELLGNIDVREDDRNCILMEKGVLNKPGNKTRDDLVLRTAGYLTGKEAQQFSALYTLAINNGLFDQSTTSITTEVLRDLVGSLTNIEEFAWFAKTIEKTTVGTTLDDAAYMLSTILNQIKNIQADSRDNYSRIKIGEERVSCDSSSLGNFLKKYESLISKPVKASDIPTLITPPLTFTSERKQDFENAIQQIKNYYLIKNAHLTNKETVLNRWYEVNKAAIAQHLTAATEATPSYSSQRSR